MNTRSTARRVAVSMIPAAVITVGCVCFMLCGNNPWPSEIAETNTSFCTIAGKFKTLDPGTSYYEHESSILDNIVEMPLGYHYLKRPYTLEPMLAEGLPCPVYFDKHGNPIEDEEPPAENVGKVEYQINIRKGVLYQPHPCFARDESGGLLYLNPETPVPSCSSPVDFPCQGTRELTAEDFRTALVRICDPALASPVYSNLKSFISGMEECSSALESMDAGSKDYRAIPFKGLQITGTHSFKLILTRKYPQAVYWMTMHFFAPVPWEALEFYKQPRIAEMGFSFNFWPVGTGAYMMKEFRDNSRIVLERNPNYREVTYPEEGEEGDRAAGLLQDAGKRVPFIDRYYFLFEKETIPSWIKFNQGYYDVNAVPNDVFDRTIVLGADGTAGLAPEMEAKGISVFSGIRMVSYYYGINMLDPVFGGNSESARKLRRAISIAVNTGNYISIFNNGMGYAAQSIIPPGIAGGKVDADTYNHAIYRWDETAGRPEQRPVEEAVRLMAEAGYPGGIGSDGKRLRLSYDHSSAGNPGFKSQFQWLKDSFGVLGIELVDNGSDLNRFRDKVAAGNWQLIRKGWVGDYPDPENFLFLFYSPNAHAPSKGRGANYTNYMNPEYDKIFTRLETMQNSPERSELVKQANRILQEDAPCIWDMHPVSFSLTHKWLTNYKPNEISSTYLKYRKINVEQRRIARREWNRLPLCPVISALAALNLVSFAVPFIRRRRKQQ